MQESPKSFRILVAYDTSETSRLALDRALETVRERPQAELHAVTVFDDVKASFPPPDVPGFEVQMQRLRTGLYKLLRASLEDLAPEIESPKVFAHIRFGDPAVEIVRLALEVRADLVISGIHGKRGVKRLIEGSVAERIVRLAPCPVLVVRPLDFAAIDSVPVPEPPCAECVAARETSGGATWWCQEHARPREAAHGYSGALSSPSGTKTGVLW